MSKKKKSRRSPEEIVARWDAAVSKIRLRCSMLKSPAARELYELLTSGTMALTDPEYVEKSMQLLDLLQKEFGPLWPKSPNVN